MGERFNFQGSSPQTSHGGFGAFCAAALHSPKATGAPQLVVFPWLLRLFPVPFSEDMFGLCFVG